MWHILPRKPEADVSHREQQKVHSSHSIRSAGFNILLLPGVWSATGEVYVCVCVCMAMWILHYNVSYRKSVLVVQKGVVGLHKHDWNITLTRSFASPAPHPSVIYARTSHQRTYDFMKQTHTQHAHEREIFSYLAHACANQPDEKC